MRIGELSSRTGVSARSLRHYENAGLLKGTRLENSYRDFGEDQVERVRQIRRLINMGIPVREMAPFLSCEDPDPASHDPSSCDAYIRAFIQRREEIDRQIEELEAARDALDQRIRQALTKVSRSA
jgi:DNA-binding transcriptional MerR regulator